MNPNWASAINSILLIVGINFDLKKSLPWHYWDCDSFPDWFKLNTVLRKFVLKKYLKFFIRLDINPDKFLHSKSNKKLFQQQQQKKWTNLIDYLQNCLKMI